jgi:UPF0755 protein
MKRFQLWMAFLLLILFSILLAASYFAREIFVPVSLKKNKVLVVVPPGSSCAQIADELSHKGLIRSAFSFRLLSRFTGAQSKMKAGTYRFSPSYNEVEILRRLVLGKSILIKVTIPEGFDLRQISELLNKKGVVSKGAFLAAARKARLHLPQIHETISGLEGFLFPNTYFFSPRMTPQEVFKPMTQEFKKQVLPLYEKAHPSMSLRKIIILASLVEKEAKIEKDRPLIAAVYYNRLRKKMPLQCDATIEYLLPEETRHLTGKDLSIKSLYNTYLHPGFPPGPIANPGLPSIKAALYPAHVPYLYYVANGKGGHRFSANYAGQLHNIHLYDDWLRARSQKIGSQ